VISSWIQQPAESRYREPSACRGCLPHPIRTPGRQVLGDCRCVVCAVVTGFYVLSTLHVPRHDTTRQETGACSCYGPIGVASSSERTAGAVVTREQVDKGPPARTVHYVPSFDDESCDSWEDGVSQTLVPSAGKVSFDVCVRPYVTKFRTDNVKIAPWQVRGGGTEQCFWHPLLPYPEADCGWMEEGSDGETWLIRSNRDV